ncbi:MAG: MATE family efflux transporter, partial [Oscillospiraceae bacterium]|nr:MATE family efflux transporter [Oscillospiraceae bacterium]
MKLKRLIGTPDFYRTVLTVAVPIMIQNGITTFVGLLDNIMVGQVGTEQMSGVAIANQIIFVYNLALFGIISGASIYGAQFFGNKDMDGVRYAFRYKLISSTLVFLLGSAVFIFWGPELIGLFLHEGESGADLTLALNSGVEYLNIMLVGLFPFALSQAYAGTLRETGETVVPMYAGIAAMLVNMVFNYILIFGKFGAPVMGVAGAAIATVLSRFVELVIIVTWAHTHPEKNPYLVGAYRSLHIPGTLVKEISIKGAPLAANEVLWSIGMTFLVQCYSMRGLEVVAAVNISNTINNVFATVFMAIGSAVSILVGQQLGAGQLERARDTAYKTIAFAGFCCVCIGAVMGLASPLFPQIYQTTPEVRSLASTLILLVALFMPQNG